MGDGSTGDGLNDRRLSSQEAIIRIDERTQSMQRAFDDRTNFLIGELQRIHSVLKEKADSSDVQEVKVKIDKVETTVETKFVTKSDFNPVKLVVYGMVGVILIAVLTAIVALVVVGGR